MIEVIITISVLTIVVLLGVLTVSKVKPAAELSKLTSDVQNLNSAIKVYEHSGGELSLTSTAADVLAKLKTVRQKSTAQSFVGFTGSMVDGRIAIASVDASYEGHRAVYDSSQKKFSVTTDSVPGFKFDYSGFFDEEYEAPVEEARDSSSLQFATNSTWVWDYEDAPMPPASTPTIVTPVHVALPTPTTPDTVFTPTTPGPAVLEKLLPPEFSLISDYFELGDFPLALALTNPNDAGSSKIIFGAINEDSWEWLDYTGPILVEPGNKILAFSESLKPHEVHHSDPRDELFNWVTDLAAPLISVSNSELEARTGSTTVTISHENNPDYLDYGGKHLPIPSGSFLVEYKLVPSVAGEGAETEWLPYSDSFDIGGPQFPRGFDVVARVVSNGANFRHSSEPTQTVLAFYELDPPLVTSSLAAITSSTEVATITIANSNPTGSSELQYQIVNNSGGTASAWTNYSSPFDVSGSGYSKGFTIVAKAIPLDSYYRESDLFEESVAVDFFGVELTGNTIFVLDTSGSMATNDRIGRLKSAATMVLGFFGESDNYAVVEYNSAASVITDWGIGSSDRKQSTILAIDGFAAGGGTLYNTALQTVIGLNAGTASQVIFLSDGLPEDSDTAPIFDAINTLVLGGLTRFDTIALGESSEILDSMAASGGGQSTHVPD